MPDIKPPKDATNNKSGLMTIGENVCIPPKSNRILKKHYTSYIQQNNITKTLVINTDTMIETR